MLNKILILIFGFFLSYSLQVSAADQLPGRFSFSGLLTQSNGEPLANPSVVLKLGIYSPDESCLLYEETQTVDTSTSAGRFSIFVGSGSPTGGTAVALTIRKSMEGLLNISSVAGCAAGYVSAPGDARKLKVTLTPSGGSSEDLTPMFVIAPSPAALVAESLSNGITGDQILKINPASQVTQGNVESVFNQLTNLNALLAGTSSLYSRVSATAGTAVPQYSGSPASPVAGSFWFDSTSNQLKYYNGSTAQTVSTAIPANFVQKSGDAMTGALTLPADGLNVGAGQIVVSGGNVGIGNGAPSAKLHVNGDIWSSNVKATGIYGNAVPLRMGVTATEYMRIDNSGNVGIGTTTPGGLLSVGNSATPTTSVVVSSNGASGKSIFTLDSSGQTTLNLVTNFSGAMYQGIANQTAGMMTGNPFPLVLGTNQVEHLRISNTGNVGIGDSNPLQKLVINGSAGAYRLYTAFVGTSGTPSVAVGSSYSGPSNTGLFSASGSDISMASQGVRSGEFRFVGGAVNHPSFAPSVTGQAIQLESAGSDANISIALVPKGAGNVGVGTTTPTEKFHVIGNLRVQGSTDCTLGNGAGGTNCSSDIRLKDNVYDIKDSLKKILSLRGVEFDWNQRSSSPGRHSIGVIAQDIEKVFPTAVIDEKGAGYKKVDYAVLIAPVIQSIKEFYLAWFSDSQSLHAELAAKDKKINELELRLQALERAAKSK